MAQLCLIWLGLLILPGATVAAEIYKTIDENGNIVFSDQPAKEAEKIEVQEPYTFDSSIMTNQPGRTGRKADTAEAPAKFTYSRLVITSPENDAAIRDNAGNFELSFTVEPPAPPEHTVQLMMDGKVHTTVTQSGTIRFENADRGTLVFQLRFIKKSSNEVIEKGPASTVSILRYIPPRARPR